MPLPRSGATPERGSTPKQPPLPRTARSCRVECVPALDPVVPHSPRERARVGLGDGVVDRAHVCPVAGLPCGVAGLRCRLLARLGIGTRQLADRLPVQAGALALGQAWRGRTPPALGAETAGHEHGCTAQHLNRICRSASVCRAVRSTSGFAAQRPYWLGWRDGRPIGAVAQREVKVLRARGA